MNKEQKAEAVKTLTAELEGAEAIFAIDYRGISVPQAAELRSGLRDADASFRVVKNRLTLRAADAAGTEDIKEHLTGPTALTFVHGDVALAAKTVSKLGDEWELLEFKGGIMDGAALDRDSFVAIAKLPGRDQLNAQFAGIVASPLTGLVRGLGSMISGLALQLQAIADQGLVTGEAPAPTEEPKADSAENATEAPAEDASDASPVAQGDDETPKEVDPPAAAADDDESENGDDGGEDGSSDGEAVDQSAASDDLPAEEPTDDASELDPAPEDSPEEEPSEEEAPEGESAGLDENDGGTGEGDADIAEGKAGEDSESEQAGDEASETSEDSDDKENE